MSETIVIEARAERIGAPVDPGRLGIVEKPLSFWETIWNQAWLRKVLILLAVAALWELIARWQNNQLLLPTLTSTIQAFFEALFGGTLLVKVWTSLKVLMLGYALGVALAALLTTLAIMTRIGNDILEAATAMLTPLPAIALLPLAMLWLGLGYKSIAFILIHSVLWPVALNTHAGFLSVSTTLRMVGRNYGLRGFGYVAKILIPAAFPSILAGLKIGWAFAWRTLIAAELVFGVTTGGGGLGWFIYENKNTLNIPYVFAGLLTVTLIGLAVENLIFRTIESRTIRRWGMAG